MLEMGNLHSMLQVSDQEWRKEVIIWRSSRIIDEIGVSNRFMARIGICPLSLTERTQDCGGMVIVMAFERLSSSIQVHLGYRKE